MDKLSIVIESLTKPRYEEDSIDRLNYHVTTFILLLAAFTIIAKVHDNSKIVKVNQLARVHDNSQG